MVANVYMKEDSAVSENDCCLGMHIHTSRGARKWKTGLGKHVMCTIEKNDSVGLQPTKTTSYPTKTTIAPGPVTYTFKIQHTNRQHSNTQRCIPPYRCMGVSDTDRTKQIYPCQLLLSDPI